MLRICRAICISDEAREPGFISSPTQERLFLCCSLTEGDITWCHLRTAGPHGGAGGIQATKVFTEQVFSSAVDDPSGRAEILAQFTSLQLPEEQNCGAVVTLDNRETQSVKGEISASETWYTLPVGHWETSGGFPGACHSVTVLHGGKEICLIFLPLGFCWKEQQLAWSSAVSCRSLGEGAGSFLWKPRQGNLSLWFLVRQSNILLCVPWSLAGACLWCCCWMQCWERNLVVPWQRSSILSEELGWAPGKGKPQEQAKTVLAAMKRALGWLFPALPQWTCISNPKILRDKDKATSCHCCEPAASARDTQQWM